MSKSNTRYAYITIDEKDIERAERMLYHIPGTAKRALSNALNRSLENARTNTISQTRKFYNVTAKNVRSTIRIYRAKPSRTYGSVYSSGDTLPLSAFRVNPNTVNGRRRTPIRVSVRKNWGAPDEIENGFIARSRAGAINGTGVFIRLGRRRMPIRQLRGPSVPQMLNNNQVVKTILDEARATFGTRLDHEIDRELNKGGR